MRRIFSRSSASIPDDKRTVNGRYPVGWLGDGPGWLGVTGKTR